MQDEERRREWVLNFGSYLKLSEPISIEHLSNSFSFSLSLKILQREFSLCSLFPFPHWNIFIHQLEIWFAEVRSCSIRVSSVSEHSFQSAILGKREIFFIVSSPFPLRYLSPETEPPSSCFRMKRSTSFAYNQKTEMGFMGRRCDSFSSSGRNPKDSMRVMVSTFMGVIFGLMIGLSIPALTVTRLNFSANLIPSGNISYLGYSQSSLSFTSFWSTFVGNGSSQVEVPKQNNITKIWVPTNPRGAERLPPGIVAAESDLYLRRLYGKPSEDLPKKPKYLVTFTVGIKQKKNVDANVRKFSDDFTIMLFHYDGKTTEWDEFEWSKRAIHVSAPKQTKWWYAKRFLHPDIVAPYDYIFIWDEDLGVDNFDPQEYLRLVKKHGLEISQPGLYPAKGAPWPMTHRIPGLEVHKETKVKPTSCSGPYAPPCAAFVEIMAPVFSREAWRCVWHLIQNDLIHGWGLDFSLRKCVDPAHEKIGVVDAQWVLHQGIPSLGNQGIKQANGTQWMGVKDRCHSEWKMFQKRIDNAEKSYYKSIGVDTSGL